MNVAAWSGKRLGGEGPSAWALNEQKKPWRVVPMPAAPVLQALESVGLAAPKTADKETSSGAAAAHSHQPRALQAASQVQEKLILVEGRSQRKALMAILGFPNLTPQDQGRMLNILERGDPALLQDLQKLAGSSAFAALPEESRRAALDAVEKNKGDALERSPAVHLATTAGLGGLPPKAQRDLMTLVGGNNPWLSHQAKRELDNRLTRPEFATSAQNQTTMLNDFMENLPLPRTVGEVTWVDAASFGDVVVLAKGEDSDPGFTSGDNAAKRYTVRVTPPHTHKARDVEVLVAQPAGATAVTVEDVAAALASLPPANLALVKRVMVEPAQNPQDATWSKDPHFGKDFHSLMATGADGVVRVFPGQAKPSPSTLAGSLLHETGHTLSAGLFGTLDGSGSKWDPWRAAKALDPWPPSGYSKTNDGEDFAEALELYVRVRGTFLEAELRSLLPGRFAFLDHVLKAQQPS